MQFQRPDETSPALKVHEPKRRRIKQIQRAFDNLHAPEMNFRIIGLNFFSTRLQNTQADTHFTRLGKSIAEIELYKPLPNKAR